MSATAPATYANNTFGALSDYARTDREFWTGSLRRAFRSEDASWTNDLSIGSSETGRQQLAEGITTTEPPSQEVNDRIEDLLATAREASAREELEEQFAGEMSSALFEYGNVTITALADRILSGRIRPDVAAEILDLLGRVDHDDTYRHRLWLLERGLTSASTRVRHGASMGIAYLRDPHAVRYLKSAIESEPVDELKRNLQQVLTYLESVR